MSSNKITLRKCVGCNEMKDSKELLRLVRIDGKVSFDPTNKANGRGAYLCKDKKCFDMAVKKKGFNRALKCPVNSEVTDQLLMEIENGSR